MSKAHLTAISRSKPSAPVRWLHEQGLLSGRVLDFGCGKGKDADTYGFEKYDPYFSPEMPEGEFDVVVCNYVINVIEEPVEKCVLIANIYRKLRSGGVAYISVRRDIKEEGYTSKGTYQENVTLPLESVRKTSGYEIYKLEKVEYDG